MIDDKKNPGMSSDLGEQGQNEDQGRKGGQSQGSSEGNSGAANWENDDSSTAEEAGDIGGDNR